jgi:ABC-type branched-subunit amino acid transport system substrate-binding protein
VDAVIGPYGSAMTDAAADVTEKHRQLMVAPAAGTTSLWEKGRRYLVMVTSPLEAATEGTIDLAARYGLKTIALINVETLTGRPWLKGPSSWLRKRAWRWSSTRPIGLALPISRPFSTRSRQSSRMS